MNKQEIIEKLKQNLAQFTALSKDEQEVLDDLRPKGFIQYLNGKGKWSPVEIRQYWKCSSIDRYRISPDYQPEPETPEIIHCKVKRADDGRYYFNPPARDAAYLDEAVNYPNFIGYKYLLGSVFDKPRIISDGKFPATIPTHVLFRRSE